MDRFARRTVDVFASITALALLAPVLACVATAVRLSLGSPVLFRQLRAGHRGRLFTLIKFRTMLDARRPDGSLLPDVDRITRVGSWLRSMSLDELPQLWNVLRGEMSLVGPRPLLPEYLPLYSPEQARRHEVNPGITGWAQVNGRNALSWEQKFRLDVWYVDHQTLSLDLMIVFRTLLRLIRRDGINQAANTTMEPFRGTVVRTEAPADGVKARSVRTECTGFLPDPEELGLHAAP